MTVPAGVIRWGTLPVPFVAAWSSETEIVVRRDPVIGNRPALFRAGRRGLGRPIFGQMDESRTRRVVTGRLCQVCARPLAGAGGHGYVLDVPYARTEAGLPLVHEPPACAACFAASLALCPGIARLRADPRAITARVRRYECVAVFVHSVEAVDGGDERLNAALRAYEARRGAGPVIGYVRPALADYDLLDLDAIACGGDGTPRPGGGP